MKAKFIPLSVFLFITFFSLTAQINNNLVVFCNEGGRFTLILNGLKENQTPQTNVRVEGLDLKVYEVKVIFEDTKLKDLNTTLTFYRTNKECVFALNKKGKKTHTMDYVSEKDILIFVNQPPPDVVNTTTQTPVSTIAQTTVNATNNTLSPFQGLVNNILAQPTDEGKLNVTLAALQNTTFTIDQIKKVLSLFLSEQTRLAFAKQFYAKIKDPAMYTAIIDSFVNEAIKQEFKLFTEGKK